MLEVKELGAWYGESNIIPSLTFSVPDKEIVCLVGRNGVGKSTTLKSLMGMVKTPTGSILFDGQEIIRKKTFERAALGIGYVPQGREIFPQLTVQENLELGLQVKGGKGKIDEDIYELFPIIKTFLNRKGGNLSGGQQQQLAIARALVSRPKLLILDEPTEGIQPSIIEDIAAAIQKVNKELCNGQGRNNARRPYKRRERERNTSQNVYRLKDRRAGNQSLQDVSAVFIFSNSF